MKSITNVLLPLLLFSLLAITAAYFIFHQSLVQNGLQLQLSAICDPELAPHPYRFPYTNVTDADDVLCGMVAFFHALIDPAYNPLLAVLFPAVAVVALVPFLEASRDRHPFVLRMPTAVGVLFQLASMGVIIPLYALLFVITHTASIRPSTTEGSKINQANAEALLFGLLLGYVLPTALMVTLLRPSVTAAWQAFPLFFALAIFVHRLVRPPSRHVQSGHSTVVVTLAFTFLISVLLHAVYVWPILTDTVALRTMFMPSVAAFDQSEMSLADGVVGFIKWDIIFGVGSIMLATLWMADSLLGLIGILGWYSIASIAFGPAAAITGVFLWRENRLNGRSPSDKVPQKME